VDFMLHVCITNDHWMQISLAEPFILQDSEKLRFQKSRKPQSTNVFSKSAGFFARHQRAAPFRREDFGARGATGKNERQENRRRRCT
jgi:hypothetical protein